MRLTVTRLRPSVPLPVYSSPGAAAFDLAAADDVEIGPGEIKLVGTGLVVAVPDGHFLAIFARSSTPLKRGLMVANGVGVLDADYCGPNDELKVQLLNVTN
jgi:dUTP pyrophosphatase